MRRIELSRKFRHDYRREKSGMYGKSLDALLNGILDLLESDEVLPPNAVDHALMGKFTGYRDCHIKPDLILIYRKTGDDVLELVRLGSHSELGL
ncbi:type II toxin-antitoxin system YafQ family toxin [Pelodictyon phaeoclathratiforme]|jgi:mRNA interferase YafQ|uniref:Addiction module toxin, RelE/StbE family n=1 Tax=Pelodictyon phaeoclathratiforme (strain DSM 5477 / BU-1) TaxID=324925 RepID=B4SFA6_PELPB|nr:type II toxin-antitoxin system YafQ family toxin [Pelodictyon phaeoclathratiforme]ACF44685.1 addiction module toxin, RelE/StbE family [Pelodictyon phaeoclathratiforme BU-1]MBV5288889.1 type II toxin-antitoxin system YafQ family toxin [Pelodictyon phaeoclathratiforme]